MKRTNLFLPDVLRARIKKASKKLGDLPMAEIIRRAIDDYLTKIGF